MRTDLSICVDSEQTGGVRQAPRTALERRPSPSPASVTTDAAKLIWE
jgi:hypothetical protein